MESEIIRKFFTWLVAILPAVIICALVGMWSDTPMGVYIFRVVAVSAFIELNVIYLFIKLKTIRARLAKPVTLLLLASGCGYLFIRGFVLGQFTDPESVISFLFYFSCALAAVNLTLYLLARR